MTQPPPPAEGIISYGGVNFMAGIPGYTVGAPLPPILDSLPLKRGELMGSSAVRAQFQY